MARLISTSFVIHRISIRWALSFFLGFTVTGPQIQVTGETSGNVGSDARRQGSTLHRSGGQFRVFALLADNHVIAIDGQTGTVLSDIPLASSADYPTTVGCFLAVSQDAKSLFVLVPGDENRPDRLWVLDATTSKPKSQFALGTRGGVFRSLSVSTRMDHVYLFGNPQRTAERVTLAVMELDAHTGRTMAEWTPDLPAGFDWWVYQGAVSSDERRLFISYHGSNLAANVRPTTGIDSFDIGPNGLVRCSSRTSTNQGCIPAHGGFVQVGDHLLVATGTALIREVDNRGQVIREFDTGLNTHLMDFALDAITRKVYAVAPCLSGSGFSVIDLGSGSEPTVQPGRSANSLKAKAALLHVAAPCGYRIAVGPDNLVVVAQASSPTPGGGPGRLMFLDSSTGNVIRAIAADSEPIDVLVTAPTSYHN